ncbi:acyltransferase domain-containing protein [Kibdelosporangium aridum]|uniref:acyltransferase domain-containing protein n=1 Tax=Kibdelosporangium aridum TaxID=2030 RepID=UPI0035EC0680
MSARSDAALREKARRLAEYLRAHPELGPDDVGGWLMNRTAGERDWRAAVNGSDRAGLLDGLTALAEGRHSATVSVGSGAETEPVFVFPGVGTQWPGMASDLVTESAVFRARLDECAQALEPFVDWSLMDIVAGPQSGSLLHRVDVAQPVLFAVMVSLAELWRSKGIEPVAVVGQCLGEVAAAAVSEALSLDDAARVAALWSRAQATLADLGALVSVQATLEVVEEWLGGYAGKLVIGGMNGPSATLVSGDADAAEDLIAAMTEAGLKVRKSAVGLATHSPHIERIVPIMRADLAPIQPCPPRMRFQSSLTGGPITDLPMDADYWCRNLRNPIRFEATVRDLLSSGPYTLLEISAHPTLVGGMVETAEQTSSASPRARDVAAWS